ncbi:HTH-type transcriptional repressor KstR [Clostridium homopropionicum DSM 5847]|uniref:HTH-type transcriptional repressor KstR n=1 Tax=Clostridium homopropionicum DSM 5847 TaxID=1121318 RepID=A0A0L6ZCY7_9CLOT|nr:TetR/AcrR family transcriptional regulator [Clostridium homopropionicum]KOA20807.1 HTH-type transcriptional repressor KstR [Clostridium homopropionicum DSM 5847]SFF88659.1 transcriptional regulator, TetR family [Clostridium homopropionicum]
MSRIIDNPRELILSKSKEILYNEGYSALNMRNVAKACQIALGTIYNYFPTKKELVMEMMIDYWKKYFLILDSIKHSDGDLYYKLEKIFNELSNFIKTFKEVWLKPELCDTSEFIQSGLEKQYLYMSELIRIIENILSSDTYYTNSELNKRLSSNEIASFIVVNFISMIQMPFFKYESFEKLLKAFLK